MCEKKAQKKCDQQRSQVSCVGVSLSQTQIKASHEVEVPIISFEFDSTQHFSKLHQSINCDQLIVNSNHTILIITPTTTITTPTLNRNKITDEKKRDKNRFSRLHKKHRKRNNFKIMLDIHNILCVAYFAFICVCVYLYSNMLKILIFDQRKRTVIYRITMQSIDCNHFRNSLL